MFISIPNNNTFLFSGKILQDIFCCRGSETDIEYKIVNLNLSPMLFEYTSEQAQS